MKKWFSLGLVIVLFNPSAVWGVVVESNRFMSTLQLAVDEANARLTQRSQKLVQEQFAITVENWPELRGKAYDVRTNGKEVIFYMMSDDDTRIPMQRAVSSMIQKLNGRVRARGRSLFYKTPLAPTAAGFLDVGTDNSHTKIIYTTAQAVPLRHLLKELKSQLGNNLSYLIPGECADRSVDWNFGDSASSQPKPIDVAMGELATLFDLKYEKRNDTHIFSGTCAGSGAITNRPKNLTRPFLSTSILGAPPSAPFANRVYRPVVYFPLVPLGD